MLPRDVILSIFERLDCLSFFRALQTCKYWNTLIKKEIDSQSPWSKRVAQRMLKENNEQCEREWFSELRLKGWSKGRIVEERRFYNHFHNMHQRYLWTRESYTEATELLCGKCNYPLYVNPIVEESMRCRNAFCWLQPSLLGLFKITKIQKEQEPKRRKIK